MSQDLPHPPGTRVFRVIATDQESTILATINFPARNMLEALLLLVRERPEDIYGVHGLYVEELL